MFGKLLRHGSGGLKVGPSTGGAVSRRRSGTPCPVLLRPAAGHSRSVRASQSRGVGPWCRRHISSGSVPGRASFAAFRIGPQSRTITAATAAKARASNSHQARAVRLGFQRRPSSKQQRHGREKRADPVRAVQARSRIHKTGPARSGRSKSQPRRECEGGRGGTSGGPFARCDVLRALPSPIVSWTNGATTDPRDIFDAEEWPGPMQRLMRWARA